jgi:predicted tellurium resistance membrane protein TerC
MAMLGLRSLYFVLSDVVNQLRYMRRAFAALLVFTPVKMLASEWGIPVLAFRWLSSA